MIEIKSRFNCAVLYRSESAVSIGDAVIEAVQSGANLREADLRGADLRGVSLSDADLSLADLRGADLSEVDRGALRATEGVTK